MWKYTMHNSIADLLSNPVSNSADLPSHPVALELSKQLEQLWSLKYHWIAEKAVLKLGQPFIGIARPKGFLQRKPQQCFLNAFRLALDHRGVYVEGFVLSSTSHLNHHAWVTLDGIHAIDVTLKDAPAFAYFGIAFSLKVAARSWVSRRPWVALLHNDEQTYAMLEDARLDPPSFNGSEPQ
jgi:hypothetical protein